MTARPIAGFLTMAKQVWPPMTCADAREEDADELADASECKHFGVNKEQPKV